jgi:hypothetical protein
MTSITIVVGQGVPGHASIQINQADTTTYLGLGPATPGSPVDTGAYDVITLPNGVSPVGALRSPFRTSDEAVSSGEFDYVDTTHYHVQSFTFQITDAQAAAALYPSDRGRLVDPVNAWVM